MTDHNYFYHALRVKAPNQPTRYFRKISRSISYPDVLKNIASLALESNRLFGTTLQIERATNEIPTHRSVEVKGELVDDDGYVEMNDDGTIGIIDTGFWVDPDRKT